MVRCFLTGVQFTIAEGFVLNRREAHELLYSLKDRAASLQRVIEQLSPLDEEDTGNRPIRSGRAGFVRKRHRLVCKAVADALAPGCPEIRLFLDWPAYRAQVRLAVGVNIHPVGEFAAPTLPDSSQDENKRQP